MTRSSILFTYGLIWCAILVMHVPHARGMEEKNFTFTHGNANAQWEGFGELKGEMTDAGLLVQSYGTGELMTILDGSFPAHVQAGLLTTSSETPLRLSLIWESAGQTYRLPIIVPNGSQRETPLLLSHIHAWTDSTPTRVGISFPPHTTLLMHSLALKQWNVAERLMQTVLSLLTFDTYKPYSINFVWGPQFATNPIARQFTFIFEPPVTLSWTYIFMICAILLVAIIWILGFWVPLLRSGNNKKMAILGVFLFFWLLLDAIMGAQFFWWVSLDMHDYVFKPAISRTFRDRDRFYDFAAFAKPLIADRRSYRFIAEREWPFFGNMRYLTYPILPSRGNTSDDTWVVYNRPDIAVSADNHLVTTAEEVISGTGTVLGIFDENSFVFRVKNSTPPL